MPISDSDNDWVQVSPAGAVCIQYSHSHATGPDWGVSGSKVFTSNLLCCKGTDFGPYTPTLSDAALSGATAGLSKPENDSYSPHSDKDITKYEEIAIEFMPKWFD